MLVVTLDPYAYAAGDPANYSDPSGMNRCESGASVFRWPGNLLECWESVATSTAGQVVKDVAGSVSDYAGMVEVACAATLLPSSGATAPCVFGAEITSTVSSAAFAALECGDGVDRDCWIGVAAAAIPLTTVGSTRLLADRFGQSVADICAGVAAMGSATASIVRNVVAQRTPDIALERAPVAIWA